MAQILESTDHPFVATMDAILSKLLSDRSTCVGETPFLMPILGQRDQHLWFTGSIGLAGLGEERLPRAIQLAGLVGFPVFKCVTLYGQVLEE